ncbi:MAG: hypothetical protein NC833_00550 [Candidatus Omnitrophica bacterium]|nr:hypothetical protein [Candidatus Omnitrophota bacterium]
MEKKDLPNPRIAALLSFVFNGLGQIYNGEIKKGLTLIFLSGLSLLILILGAIFLFYFIKTLPPISFLIWGVSLFLFGLTGMIIIGVYSISDAYNKAKKMLENGENT